ncbi:MAG: hypothetical protein H3Z54_10055 [archaeon]|nr:hypothetical protein [archaeon]
MKKDLSKFIKNAIDKAFIEFDSSFHDYMKRFESVEELIDDFSKYVWYKARLHGIGIEDVKEYLKEKWTKSDEYGDSITDFYKKQVCTNCGSIMPGYILFVCTACRKPGTLQPYTDEKKVK